MCLDTLAGVVSTWSAFAFLWIFHTFDVNVGVRLISLFTMDFHKTSAFQ